VCGVCVWRGGGEEAGHQGPWFDGGARGWGLGVWQGQGAGQQFHSMMGCRTGLCAKGGAGVLGSLG
jgi:hypothetical protein